MLVQPELSADLIGMEAILDEITTSIIRPIELNHPAVTIKKGIVLCGPPGTGKRRLVDGLPINFVVSYIWWEGSRVFRTGLISTIDEHLKSAY